MLGSDGEVYEAQRNYGEEQVWSQILKIYFEEYGSGGVDRSTRLWNWEKGSPRAA